MPTKSQEESISSLKLTKGAEVRAPRHSASLRRCSVPRSTFFTNVPSQLNAVFGGAEPEDPSSWVETFGHCLLREGRLRERGGTGTGRMGVIGASRASQPLHRRRPRAAPPSSLFRSASCESEQDDRAYPPADDGRRRGDGPARPRTRIPRLASAVCFPARRCRALHTAPNVSGRRPLIGSEPPEGRTGPPNNRLKLTAVRWQGGARPQLKRVLG